MGGGKGDAPDPPDYQALVEGSIEVAQIYDNYARDYMSWQQEVQDRNYELLDQVLGTQLPQMQAAFEQAQADRARYEEVFQPLENDLIKEFQTYDTQARREQEAAQRITDVRTSFEAQRRNATQQLEDYGIDPSQTRSQALDLGYRAQEAATSALAANQGRQVVEQTGRALRGEAINIGRGMPAQVAQAQGIVNQTAGGAVGNSNQTGNTAANMFGAGMQGGQVGLAGYGQAANIQNMGYNNALDQFNANQSANSWGGIGALTGQLGSAYIQSDRKWFSEGGAVPEDGAVVPQPGDRHPVMLADDEYVIPADVVKRKGTEFFDKLMDRYKDGGEYEAKRQGVEA